MKLLLYGALLLAVWLTPIRGTDVGKLIPVEVLLICEKEGVIEVRTDTGDLGNGQTLAGAFANLKDTAPGVIYLDTAEYVLLEEAAEPILRELSGYLKQTVKVCRAAEDMELEGLADFLSVHEPGVKLKEAAKGSEIPSIDAENRRNEKTG